MTELLCERIAVARTAGGRIGHTARRDDELVADIVSVFTGDDECIIFFAYIFDSLFEADIDAFSLAFKKQCIDDVRCLVGDRKDSLAPFRLQRTAVFIEELYRIGRLESVDGRIHETRVGDDVVDESLDIAVVGDVAATLAGDVHLPADFGVGIQKDDFVFLICTAECEKQSRGTGADTDHFCFI